jgi:peptide/nickel transport system substrate-binding protein
MHETCSQPTEAGGGDERAHRPGLTRRAAIRIVLSGAGTALLAACAPTSPSPVATPTAVAPPAKPTVAPTAAPAAAAAPVSAAATPTAAASTVAAKPAAAASSRTGGTLRVGTIGDIITLDGHNSNPNQRDFAWSVFDQLTTYDVKLQPQPGLAESWELSPDLKQIKLNLRRGVQWHSGRDFTSDDVNYNLLRVRDPKVQVPTLRNWSNWYTTIDIPDKYTIVMTSDLPRPAVFDFLQFFNQVDKDSMEAPDAKVKSVGTGPFVFQEWAQGDHLSFTKNPTYWRTGRPYLDGMTVNVFKDTQSLLTQFEAGALDVVKEPAPRDLARYRADSNYRAIVHPVPGGWYTFGLNLSVPPLDNKQVRQALNFALDRARFADLFLFGTGVSESLPWPPVSPAFEAAKQNFYTFDLDKASALLKEAGVSSAEFDLIVTNSSPLLVDFAPVFQADLAKIGITLNIRPLDFATFVNEIIPDRKYRGLMLANTTYAQLEPSSLYTTARQTDPVSNNQGYSDAHYTELVTSVSSEPDATRRKALYAQLNDLLLDESFLLVLASQAPVLATRANVQGIEPTLLDAYQYYNAWLG